MLSAVHAGNATVLGVKKAHPVHVCQAQEAGPQSTDFCHGQQEPTEKGKKQGMLSRWAAMSLSLGFMEPSAF